MGQALNSSTKISNWVFPNVPLSYDETHPLLVHFPAEEAGLGIEVPALLLAGAGKAQVAQLGTKFTSCVIYFHSNGCDIGQCAEDMRTFRDGALNGDAVVLCPEYPGYGLLNEYEPSVLGINLVARAAWRFVIGELGFRPSQVLLWGRSIGTGPAIALAHAIAEEAAAESVREDVALLMRGSAEAAPSPPAAQPWWRGPGTALPSAAAAAGADAGAGPRPQSPEAAAEALEDASSQRSGAEEQGYQRLDQGQPDELEGAPDIAIVPPSGSHRRCKLEGGFLAPSRSPGSEDPADAGAGRSAEDAVGAASRRRIVGAVILLAPPISVAEVVQHHVPSRLAAELVGPLWETLKMAEDHVMEGVPLLVIHPQLDEIVPKSHGQAIYERAASRTKFGVWLCNAAHNICLHEDHMRIANTWLSEVTRPNRLSSPRIGLLVSTSPSRSPILAGGEPPRGPRGDLGELGADEPPVSPRGPSSSGAGSEKSGGPLVPAVERVDGDEASGPFMAVAARLFELGLSGKAEDMIEMSL